MSATYATILWENFDRGKLLETCPIIILNWIHLSEAFIFWTASLSPYMQVTYQLAKAGKGKAQLGTAQSGCTNLLITKWPPLMSGHYSCRIPPPFIASPRLNISYHSEIQPLLQNSVFHFILPLKQQMIAYLKYNRTAPVPKADSLQVSTKYKTWNCILYCLPIAKLVLTGFDGMN